jgi:phospholipid/cholesterol/gamma-HCH transport system substrate-binding protein
MRSLLKEHGAEALIGLLVVLIAVWFGWFAFQRTGGGRVHNAIMVSALFPNATGISPGTDVRVAGIKIGQVAGVKLDPKTFQAEVALAIDPNSKLPDDSSAAIASEGILGGTYMNMIPGGSSTPFKNGDVIVDTQGSVDLMSMVGQFINKSGGDSAKPASPAASAPGAAPANP